ncbi:DUF1127 domain-containing protein [Roseibium aestuarii]|uniref:DUF1127 domain-containing protein n=1 Tax=Roseibium aestuarii TaxID=2600299 RepID=A0ABW4JX12_9HYPH|nr:DUF1127 domain-containing protein [Roseibium aestuarii]
MNAIDTIILPFRRTGRVFGGGLGALLWLLVERCQLWWRVGHTRRQLAMLSDEALADIGLTRDAALEEAMRPFWNCAPATGRPAERRPIGRRP